VLLPGDGTHLASTRPRGPYHGLLPFDQAHAEVFYGRQRMTADLIVKLTGRLTGC